MTQRGRRAQVFVPLPREAWTLDKQRGRFRLTQEALVKCARSLKSKGVGRAKTVRLLEGLAPRAAILEAVCAAFGKAQYYVRSKDEQARGNE